MANDKPVRIYQLAKELGISSADLRAKIGALGIRVRRGCTFHGLAFNIAGESVAPFQRINPCGYEGLQVVSLGDLGGPASLDAVKGVLLQHLAVQLGLQLEHSAAPPAAAA